MVEEAWLDEGDVILTKRTVDYWVRYVEYIKKHYPLIHDECCKKVENNSLNPFPKKKNSP